MEELQPICRSITGAGLRTTLNRLGDVIPLTLTEVPTDTPVLDWSVPKEWNIRDAYIARPDGTRVVDFRQSALHVLNYSEPVRAKLRFAELAPHLHRHRTNSDWIPYLTSYYAETWGFCVTGAQYAALEAEPDTEFEVVVDSDLTPGFLTYGEALVPGTSDDGELLIIAHVCHPSMCNDNLSGNLVAMQLCRELLARPPERYGVRFLFAPGTIGAITWLEQNRQRVDAIRGGLTLTCLGDPRGLTYKRTYAGTADIDRAAAQVLAERQPENHHLIDFYPYGYDERQFNAPGFRAPVGSLMRGQHGKFPEYHSSADDLSLVQDAQLEDAIDAVDAILRCLQRNRTYRNLAPFGEPQLGRRGIYRSLGGTTLADLQFAIFWVLTAADGETDLLAIAERSGLPFDTLDEAARILCERDLLAEVAAPAQPPA